MERDLLGEASSHSQEPNHGGQERERRSMGPPSDPASSPLGAEPRETKTHVHQDTGVHPRETKTHVHQDTGVDPRETKTHVHQDTGVDSRKTKTHVHQDT